MKRFIFTVIFFTALTLALTACGRKNSDKTDLTSTHTTAAGNTTRETIKETMAETANGNKPLESSSANSSPAENSAPVTPESEKNKTDGTAGKNVFASIHTYKEGNISIEYPVISNLNDPSVQEKVNNLLRGHALEIVDAYEMDREKDSLFVTCNVISADRRRVTAVYTGNYTPDGASYPTNLFYTNTVDTAMGTDIGLTDYADSYTLAGYILSGDCQFEQANADVEKELMTIKNFTDIETYTTMFRQADFPYKGTDSTSQNRPIRFPEVFSYEEKGTIYVSIPVSHALGDYALVRYTPESK